MIPSSESWPAAQDLTHPQHGEPTFILRASDPVAVVLIEKWIELHSAAKPSLTANDKAALESAAATVNAFRAHRYRQLKADEDQRTLNLSTTLSLS